MNRLRMITLEELLEMRENRDPFILVDVLSEETYRQGHIPGAVNIPLDRLKEKAPEILKKNETIVVYCASYACHASTRGARELMVMGYGGVLDFKGGRKGWLAAGLELQTEENA